MKFWYTMFIMTFLVVYGTLTIALLGHWAYERVKVLRGTGHYRGRKKRKSCT